MPLIKNNKVYDLAKWTAVVVLPALNVLWVAVATVWGIPFVQEVSTTLTAINTFLGALVGFSNAQYNSKEVK